MLSGKLVGVISYFSEMLSISRWCDCIAHDSQQHGNRNDGDQGSDQNDLRRQAPPPAVELCQHEGAGAGRQGRDQDSGTHQKG